MKYEITQELVERIKNDLFMANTPVQIFDSILKSLVAKPIIEKAEEPKTE